jgi:hypothetical protein
VRDTDREFGLEVQLVGTIRVVALHVANLSPQLRW